MLETKTIYNEICDSPFYISEIGVHINPRGRCGNLRTNFVIHYVIEGEGLFCGKIVKKGQGFIIYPYSNFLYENNGEKDWSYCWVIVDGKDAKNLIENSFFPQENGIFDAPYMDNLLPFFENALLSEELYEKKSFFTGFLNIISSFQRHSCLSKNLVHNNNLHKQLFEKAIIFIKQNLNKKITTSSIIAYLNISYSLLYLIFIENSGNSPINYILFQRISKAKDLLVKTDYSIKAIASSVGYADQLAFSKTFAKYEHVSPTDYRKSHTKKPRE